MQRIVVIEDDESNRMLLQAVLAEEGYDVILPEGPGDPLAQLSAVRPDLLLLDLLLNERGDGLALARATRADSLLMHLPIIVLSAARHLLRQHADELMELRCHVLEKPFDLSDLLALIEAAVQQPIDRVSTDPGQRLRVGRLEAIQNTSSWQ